MSRTEYIAIAAAIPLTANKAKQVAWVRTARYYPAGHDFMLLGRVSDTSDADIAAAFAGGEYDKTMGANMRRLVRDDA